MFDNILLEKEHEDLLILLVEASRKSFDQPQKFFIHKTTGGDFIHHPGLPKVTTAYFGHVEYLGRTGLISFSYTSRTSGNFDVLPLGYKYYEHIKSTSGESSAHIEESVIQYLQSSNFQEKYALAFDRWKESEKLLWSEDVQNQLTTIGHLCREAVQSFTTILVEKTKPDEVDSDITHVVNRLKTVIKNAPNLGKSSSKYFDALIKYWSAVNDLIQKQEHGSRREQSPLNWEDGRRVVFNTMILMYEIDRILNI